MSDDMRINPDRLRAIVIDAVKSQPPEVAEELRKSLTWHGADIKTVDGHPDRLTGGLSTPSGFRK